MDLPLFVENTEENIDDLFLNSSYLSVLQNYTFSNVSRIDEIHAATENATILANSLKNANSSTTDIVNNLRMNLDTLLDQTRSQNITAIELLLQNLGDRLSYNATILYQELQNMVTMQAEARSNLEATLLELQQQTDYLERVNSLLPEGCT